MNRRCIFTILLVGTICLTGCRAKEEAGEDNSSANMAGSPIQMQEIVNEWGINYDKIEKQNDSSGVCSQILFDSELGIEVDKQITISGVLLCSSGDEIELAAENQMSDRGQIGKILRCQTKSREHILIPDGSNVFVTGQFDDSKDDMLKDCEITVAPEADEKYQPNVMTVLNGENTVLVQGEITRLEKIEQSEPKDFSLYDMYRANAAYRGVISGNGEELPFLCDTDEGLETGKKVALKAVLLTHEDEKILGVQNNYYILD